MTFDMNEWGPPLTILAIALTSGIGYSFTLKKDEREAKRINLRGLREDADKRRKAALEALAALETQRPQMDPDDYEHERRALLKTGAAAMRELETNPKSADTTASADRSAVINELTGALQRGEIDAATFATTVAALSNTPPSAPAPPPPHASEQTTSSLSPAWQGGLYALAGIGIIGGLLYFAQGESVPRRDGAGMTGNQELGTTPPPPNAQQGVPPWVEEERAKAQAALKENPKDINAYNTLTQLSLTEPAKAWKFNQQAREIDPENPDALVYRAVITSIMGMPDKAQQQFDEILAKNPDHGAGWAYKGLTLLEASRFEEAAAALQTAVDKGVNDSSILNALSAAKNGGKPGGAPPPSPQNNAAVVSGTVDLSPDRSTFKAQVLYINVSDPSGGPPIAALKLPPGPYPMTFKITEADKIPMAGNRPFPNPMVLKARLDEDGNAFSKSPTDPIAVINTVQPGASGITLMMK